MTDDLNERIDELVERERLVLMAAPGSPILGALRHGIEAGLRERALPPEVRELVEAARKVVDEAPMGCTCRMEFGGCISCDLRRAVEALEDP